MEGCREEEEEKKKRVRGRKLAAGGEARRWKLGNAPTVSRKDGYPLWLETRCGYGFISRTMPSGGPEAGAGHCTALPTATEDRRRHNSQQVDRE